MNIQADIFQSSAWGLIMQTDLFTRGILTALACLSITCLAIVIFKKIEFYRELKALNALIQATKSVIRTQDFEKISRMHHHSIGAQLLNDALNEFKRVSPPMHALSKRQAHYLETRINQTASGLILDLESYLSFLNSSGTISPLIGLFGTIWGLIHAFLEISIQKSADLTIIAPGIAEALLTTLAGLIVAIPALIAFHHLSQKLRITESKLYELSDILISVVILETKHEDAL